MQQKTSRQDPEIEFSQWVTNMFQKPCHLLLRLLGDFLGFLALHLAISFLTSKHQVFLAAFMLL